MSEAERHLTEDRANRNAARGVFDAHVARLKGDVAAHGGIAGKAREEAGKRLLDAGKQGLAIAGESKGIVAGTVAALGLWLFRKPLIEAAKGLFNKPEEPADVQQDQAILPETAKE
jgi:hypothetical protein